MSTRAVGHNAGNSTHIRGAIDVTNLVCVLCKTKHGGAATCYAHAIVDGKAICVFCEDGEPCMHEQRTKKAAASHPPAAVISKAPTLAHPGSPWRKFGSLALPPKEKSMQTAVARTNGHAPSTPAIKLCGREGCGKKLQDRNQSGFCAAHFGDSRVKARGGTPGRVCSTPGCGQSLRSDNKSGVCKPCSKAETKAAHRGTKSAKRETVARRRPGIEPVTEMLQLQVTEVQLDRFLGTVDWNGVVARLPAEMKLTLANHYFAAGLDQGVVPKPGTMAEAAAA